MSKTLEQKRKLIENKYIKKLLGDKLKSFTDEQLELLIHMSEVELAERGWIELEIKYDK